MKPFVISILILQMIIACSPKKKEENVTVENLKIAIQNQFVKDDMMMRKITEAIEVNGLRNLGKLAKKLKEIRDFRQENIRDKSSISKEISQQYQKLLLLYLKEIDISAYKEVNSKRVEILLKETSEENQLNLIYTLALIEGQVFLSAASMFSIKGLLFQMYVVSYEKDSIIVNKEAKIVLLDPSPYLGLSKLKINELGFFINKKPTKNNFRIESIGDIAVLRFFPKDTGNITLKMNISSFYLNSKPKDKPFSTFDTEEIIHVNP
jgi:hypothetical protein